MGKNSKNLVLFVAVCMLIIFGWNYIQKEIWPPPKTLTTQQRKDVRDYVGVLSDFASPSDGLATFSRAAVNGQMRQKESDKQLAELAKAQEDARKDVRDCLGALGDCASPGDGLAAFARAAVNEQMHLKESDKQLAELAKAQKAQAARPKPKHHQYVDLGNKDFFLQVQTTNIGGAVNRVILTHFKHADELGRHDKTREHFHLVRAVGDRTEFEKSFVPTPDEEREFAKMGVKIGPGNPPPPSPDDDFGSFLLYHYAKPGDLWPVDTLGTTPWKLVSPPNSPDAERQVAAYETELKDAGVKITKTFSLEKKHYHIGLTVKVERLKDAIASDFRYQLSGARGLPIEGKWYAGVYRNAMFGWTENKDSSPKPSGKRHMEDAGAIHTNSGSDKMTRSETTIRYAAATTQYFASAIAVDDQQPNKKFVEYARATAEGRHPKDKPQFGDLTPRMISETLKVDAEPIEHKYILYHGPIKVRLLKQFREEATAVDPDLVERYAKDCTLETMTDYQSESFIGRFANSIFWTDITIGTTNAMHWVLGHLRRVIPWPGLTIIVLTLVVRGFLYPLSRRQQANMKKMQDKMKEMQPELKALEDKYKDGDKTEYQQQKMKLMTANGVNPLSQLGGCLLMFAQMPIFMGLYYCLMENVFFRLESFLWIPNLAAPDMLFKFGEIPYISAPDSLGSPVYLGPYFNLLPIIAVAFMFVQQKLFTPPPTDEQQRMQQSMFKYMMIFMGFIFYKVAAGLCIYFITSSLWGLAERKLLPKPKATTEITPTKGGKAGPRGKDRVPEPEKSWAGKQRAKVADLWKKLLDAAEKK